MGRFLSILMAPVWLCVSVAAAPFDYALLDRVLSRFVDANGQVDYAGLKSDRDLDAYVARLARMGPGIDPEHFPTRNDSLAYWVNAYNALVLTGVVSAYPVASVTDIAPDFGFFKTRRFAINGQMLTLDGIEHEILRPIFQDPRIHAAINCAAASCPKLRASAFVPDRLDTQLEAAMHEMVRSAQHVRIDRENRVLYLSKIFEWFASDFTTHLATGATVVDYVMSYLPEADRRFLAQHDVRVVYLPYDWALNAASIAQ